MHEEPYRWLEAINNRRDYIRDQLSGGTPVFALSRPEGILLVGVGTGRSKVFELFDRQAMAALGHPVDIEKVRQTLIQAAHTEAYSRSPQDVTLNRLVHFSLSPVLKAAFEQIFQGPLIVETLLAEVAERPKDDSLLRLSFDGSPKPADQGIAVACNRPENEPEAVAWLRSALSESSDLDRCVSCCLTLWQGLAEGSVNQELKPPRGKVFAIPGKTVEVALLERKSAAAARYRTYVPGED
ncbi:MAG: hypothetical protein ACFE0O_10930 [Opitutales bacterium]